MQKQLPCVSVAFFLVTLLLIPSLKTEAQVKQTVSVQKLTLGVVYQSAAEQVAQHFRPLVEYIARKLEPRGEIKSTVVVTASAPQLIPSLEQGRVDFYMESPFPTYLINRSGIAKLLLRRWKGGMSEYRGLIVTKADRVARLEDLRGKMIAFEDPGSTSGYFLPKLLLIEKGFPVVEKSGLAVKVSPSEIGYVFAAMEKNVVKLVLQEKVAAGAISNDDYASLDNESKASLSILAESESLPRHLVSVRRNMPEPVVKRLKEILLGMDRDEEGQKILRQTDNTIKFDTLPGGEEQFRRKLINLYHPRAG